MTPSDGGVAERPRRLSFNSSARQSALFSTRGKGCEGSIVTGVSSGSTCSSKNFVANARSVLRELSPAARYGYATPPASAQGAGSSKRLLVRELVEMLAQPFQPLHERQAACRRASCNEPRSSSICCRMPATRISTNSSRLLAVMARNFTRSSRRIGEVVSLFEHPAIELQPRLVAVQVAALRRWRRSWATASFAQPIAVESLSPQPPYLQG